MSDVSSAIKIKRWSRLLRYFTFGYLWMAPLSPMIFWLCNGEPISPWFRVTLWPEGLIDPSFLKPISELTLTTKLMAFLVTLIPEIFSMLALWFLAQLFRLFQEMEFFSRNSVRNLRKMGLALLAGQLVYPIYTMLLSLVLTIQNPEGKRMITAAFGTSQFNWTVVAIAIILASWILDEGRKLQEEQEATV